jgi:hypothetical protein
MGDVSKTHERFLSALSEIAGGQMGSGELTSELRTALLEFASETPDNLKCAERIEVGRVGHETGLKISRRELLFKEIAHVLEDCPPPAPLTKALPDLSEEDWDAFGRMTTLIYCLLSQRMRPSSR